MMVDDIAGFLQAAGVGTQGTDLFKYRMPDAPDSALCIYEDAGHPPEMVQEGIVYDNPSLQVMARDKTYSVARSKIESIVKLIGSLRNTQIGPAKYLRVIPTQSPFPLGVDDQNRHRLVVNFEVARQEA